MQTSVIVGTVTRPADTTTYTIGDVVGTGVLQFQPTGESLGLGGIVKSAACVSSQNATTKPDLQLWLFAAAPASQTDNAAFAPSDSEMLQFIGRIDFATGSWKAANAGSAAAGNSACIATALELAVPGTVYGVLVTQNAYVPVSAEVITVNLNVLRKTI